MKRSKTSIVDSIADGQWSRRDFVSALGAAGLGVAAVPVVSGRALGSSGIRYFTWSGYEDPAFHKKFTEKHGDVQNFTYFPDEESGLQKLRAGFSADLAHPCTYAVPRWRDAGVIEPIDTSRLSNYANVWQGLQDMEIAKSDGKTWFVPFDWGNSSVLFRTDLVDPKYQEEHTWEIMWDEAYKGRLGMYDSVDGAVIVAGLMAEVEDPFNMSDDELDAARNLLRAQNKILRFWWQDNTTVEQGLASGELVAAYAWNSSVVALKKQGLPVEYMNPKEGILCWVCGLVKISSGEADEQVAYDMIDSMLDPMAGKYMIEEWGYGHANKLAFDLVEPALLADRGLSDPNALFEQGVFLDEISRREKYEEMFTEVKAGL